MVFKFLIVSFQQDKISWYQYLGIYHPGLRATETGIWPNNILVLDQGQLVEQGTHQQLIEKQGAYWSQWRVQTGGVD